MKLLKYFLTLCCIFSLLGCASITKEEYDAVIQERDALKTQLEALQNQTVTVDIVGYFTATVRDLIPDYTFDDTTPHVAVVTQFQSDPFTVYVGDLATQLEIGKTYNFEIETIKGIEISQEKLDHISANPEVILPLYNARIISIKPATEDDYGLGPSNLNYQLSE